MHAERQGLIVSRTISRMQDPSVPVSQREHRNQSIGQPTWLLPQPSKNKDCDAHRGTARYVHVVTSMSGMARHHAAEKPPATSKGIPEFGRFLGRCPSCAGFHGWLGIFDLQPREKFATHGSETSRNHARQAGEPWNPAVHGHQPGAGEVRKRVSQKNQHKNRQITCQKSRSLGRCPWSTTTRQSRRS